ncbi:hypothetical protein BDA99DRAFT_533867 [Phascolomyces articulosus]|uniref:Association with the SNF1 complex (ASC) domain-containing protein n=1 Tax=Phascolomyces articulosus TaxID=60185 RepID=A0AAD5K7R7_9FUNG|nr:hypothetical protein BDA99DRAFT_533867 [Phascolomyces articulosus]
MGNSNSTEYNPNTNDDRENSNESRNGHNNESTAAAGATTITATPSSTSSGYQFENKSPVPPAIVTTETSSSHHKHVPFRLSVTTVPDEDSAPPSATSETAPPLSNQPNDDQQSLTSTPTTATTPTTTTKTQAVPLSTGKSGWVSSTGNTSPWYGGSLSSSASSHHRSDSVRGPYYRTRGMSINREQEIEEEQSQQQPSTQRLSRNRSIVHQSKTGIPTIISWSQGGHNVYVTGTFNGWKHKIKLVKSTQDFAAVLELPPGTHRLKFIVDDEWKCSNEMETATDPDGNLVNYLQVVDENEDSIEELGGGNDSINQDAPSRSSTPTSEYTSEIPPDLLALAQSLSTEDGEGSSGDQSNITGEWDQQQPPSLPPHLEKVLLNSQNLSDEDNSVLPEPNHVTLNHLYASSIKDNVMALSTTTRYRKKVWKKQGVFLLYKGGKREYSRIFT